jgi:hypothetical protein
MLLNGIYYAGVADGCSASEDSDVGSRAIIHWFRHELRKRLSVWPANRFFGQEDKPAIISSLRLELGPLLTKLGSPYALDATINFIFAHRGFSTGYVFMQGDGVIVFKHRDKPTVFVEVDWDQSMPPYLSYLLDESRQKEFVEQAKDNDLRGRVKISSEDNVTINHVQSAEAVTEAGMLFPFDLKEVETVAVFSDGVQQFRNRNGLTLADSLTNFDYVGEWMVKRKCIGALRLLKKEMVEPVDDFSMAVLRIEHGEESAVEGGGESISHVDAVELRS